jgi:hypothetical protein
MIVHINDKRYKYEWAVIVIKNLHQNGIPRLLIYVSISTRYDISCTHIQMNQGDVCLR